MTAVKASRNKARGKQDERDVARIIGGVRHLADTGGAEDVAHPLYAVQVKGGKTVTTAVARLGWDTAVKAAEGTDKHPMLVLVDRSGARVRRFVVFELDGWAEREGLADRDTRAAAA